MGEAIRIMGPSLLLVVLARPLCGPWSRWPSTEQVWCVWNLYPWSSRYFLHALTCLPRHLKEKLLPHEPFSCTLMTDCHRWQFRPTRFWAAILLKHFYLNRLADLVLLKRQTYLICPRLHIQAFIDNRPHSNLVTANFKLWHIHILGYHNIFI